MLGFIGAFAVAYFFRGGVAYLPLIIVISLELFNRANKGNFVYRRSDIVLMAVSLYFLLLALLNPSDLSSLILAELTWLIFVIIIGINASKINKAERLTLYSIAFTLFIVWLASFYVSEQAISLYNAIFVWGGDRLVPYGISPARFYEPVAFLFILMFAANSITKIKHFLLTVPTLTPWTIIYLLLPKKLNLSYFIKMTAFIVLVSWFLNTILSSAFISAILEQKIISVEQRFLKLENIYPFNLFGFPEALDYSETFLVRYSQNFGYVQALVFYCVLNYCLYARCRSFGFLILANTIISANPFPIAIIFAMAPRWKENRYE